MRTDHLYGRGVAADFSTRGCSHRTKLCTAHYFIIWNLRLSKISREASKGRRATLQTALLRCAAGSSVSPTARHAARRIIEGYWTLSGALFFVSGNWFCESVTVGARRDFFFARTAQPFGRVRTPGTDQPV